MTISEWISLFAAILSVVINLAGWILYGLPNKS